MLEAAVALLEQADLADLLSFLGTRAVADAADVQPATVHHHFANRDENPKPNARLAAAVLAACLAPTESETTLAEVTALVERSPDVDELAALRQVARTNLEHFLARRRTVVATFAGAAAAANDPVARDLLRDEYGRIQAQYRAAFGTVADYLGRRYDTDGGFDAETLAVFCTALVDGLSIRHQFDPDAVKPDLFGELVLRLLEAVSVPADAEMADEALVERLLQGRDRVALPADSKLDPAKRNKIVDAAGAIYDRAGITGVTVTTVAKEAGVSRSTVIANFGGRSGLAAAVWSRHVPELDRRFEADRARALPLVRVVERHLHRVVDVCRSAPDLTLTLLDGMVGRTLRRSATGERTDPARTELPLSRLLATLLHETSGELRADVADTWRGALDIASTVTYLAMVRSVIRPDESSSATVQYVMDLFFDGILRPREDRD